MTSPASPSAELLMEHRDFLRGLSRSLVVDEQRAEDVVQETYLAVLRKPPPPAVRLRAWLAAIARNLALRSRRTEGRVRRREARAARGERVEATADVAARVETQRRVADAVAALAEPGRSAIVWRYFDGLTPSEIARRERVSVRTIESRLRRARESLRARLDGSFGGRATWQAALLPLAGWGGGAAHGTAATTGATGSAPTASGLGTAAAVGVTVMSVKTMVGIAIACAAGAFFAGWQLKTTAPALTADADRTATQDEGPLLGAETTRRMAVEADLEALRAEHARLRGELERLRAAAAASAAPDGATAPRPARDAPAGPAYVGPAFEQALEGIDWGAAGEAVNHLVPLLVKLAAAFRDEGDITPSELAGIGKWNNPLLELALTMQERELPGTGTNGAFTHPAVIVNLLHAALERAGKPLSEAQLDILRELGDRFLADDERRTSAYTDDVPALQRMIEEAELKDRFYASATAMLTPAQRDVLHPPGLRDRLGVDLFSSGVILHPLTKPIRFEQRAELAPKLSALVVEHFSIPAELRDVVEDAAGAWARSFTDAELAQAGDRILRESGKLSGGIVAGWAPVAYARSAARKMLAFERALLERLPAGAKAREIILRGAPYFAVPVRR